VQQIDESGAQLDEPDTEVVELSRGVRITRMASRHADDRPDLNAHPAAGVPRVGRLDMVPWQS
jgi:hypothetical protein